MGDTRNRNGVWEHNNAGPGLPEDWARFGYDQAGHPIMVYQSDTATVTLDPQDGGLIFAFGAHLVKAPPTVAAQVNDDLAKQVPLGAGKVVGVIVAGIQKQIDDKLAEKAVVMADFDKAIQAKQAQLGGKP